MTVKDLIEKLQKFDSQMAVYGYSEENDTPRMFDLHVPRDRTQFRRGDNGGIMFLSPKDPDGMEGILLQLDAIE